jgi:hypothetical protein
LPDTREFSFFFVFGQNFHTNGDWSGGQKREVREGEFRGESSGIPLNLSRAHRSTRVPYVRTSVRGPKTMGEAHHSLSFRTLPIVFIRNVVEDLRFLFQGCCTAAAGADALG